MIIWFFAIGFVLFIIAELIGFVRGYSLSCTLFKSIMVYSITVGVGVVASFLVRSLGSSEEPGDSGSSPLLNTSPSVGKGRNVDIEVKDMNRELARNPQKVAKEIKRLIE